MSQRYYGKSLPFGNKSFDGTNIGLLTVEQALADYAVLLTEIKQQLSAPNVPVIAFGGRSVNHTVTPSPGPSFKAPWRLGDITVGRGNAGWTTSNSRWPCPCQNCSQCPPVEMSGRGSLLNSPVAKLDLSRIFQSKRGQSVFPAHATFFLHTG